MTTVYVPRPIRTVEDAEGLPVGTVAVRDYWHEDGYRHYDCARKIDSGTWFQIMDSGEYLSAAVIGWTALVPVEATEVYGARDKAGAVSRADAGTVDPRAQLEKHITERRALGHADTLVSRPVLPWEAVEDA